MYTGLPLIERHTRVITRIAGAVQVQQFWIASTGVQSVCKTAHTSTLRGSPHVAFGCLKRQTFGNVVLVLELVLWSVGKVKKVGGLSHN